MIPFQMSLISPTMKRTAGRVIRWTALDAILGAVGGAVFGGVFGAIETLLQFDPPHIVSVAGYFAVCGGAAGILVGIYGALIDDAEAMKLEMALPQTITHSARRVESVSESGVPAQSQPQNRLAARSIGVRQRSEAVAAHNPSWN